MGYLNALAAYTTAYAAYPPAYVDPDWDYEPGTAVITCVRWGELRGITTAQYASEVIIDPDGRQSERPNVLAEATPKDAERAPSIPGEPQASAVPAAVDEDLSPELLPRLDPVTLAAAPDVAAAVQASATLAPEPAREVATLAPVGPYKSLTFQRPLGLNIDVCQLAAVNALAGFTAVLSVNCVDAGSGSAAIEVRVRKNLPNSKRDEIAAVMNAFKGPRRKPRS